MDDWLSPAQSPVPSSGKRPRKIRALASCIRVEEDSIVFLPVRITPAKLPPDQKTELRSLLEQALERLGV